MKKILTALIIAVLIFALNAPAENFPSGGYQGGTHGNIKVKTWSGTLSGQWNDAGNWCPAIVPGPQDDVVISSNATNMPEITVDGMSCNNLVIKNGARVTINPGIFLTINGHLTIEEE